MCDHLPMSSYFEEHLLNIPKNSPASKRKLHVHAGEFFILIYSSEIFQLLNTSSILPYLSKLRLIANAIVIISDNIEATNVITTIII